jgi:alpha-amylase
MFVMVDIVLNHVGYVPLGTDFSSIVPFNDPKYYHEWCEIEDWNNQTQVEECRLCGLPDLNTESEAVKDILFKWLHDDILKQYMLDGVRLDAFRHINPRFW